MQPGQACAPLGRHAQSQASLAHLPEHVRKGLCASASAPASAQPDQMPGLSMFMASYTCAALK